MNLYICGSNRKGNCYQIMQDLKDKEDKAITLAGKNIKYCLGCCKCSEGLEKYCVLQDDMEKIYQDMAKADKIIFITPIYMNHITGILKNVLDRLNPYMSHPELLEGKTVYIITVGQIEEKENETSILDYYKELYEKTLNKKCIIFSNSKSEVENNIAHLKKIAKLRNSKDIYYVHHANISNSLRR